MHAVNDLVGCVVEERYRIEQELGAGAMGAVYRGRHVKVGRTVAIKVLHDHLVRDPLMVERFEREARIAAKLKHRNLVSLIDIGTTPDGQRAMILEFAPGKSLAEHVSAPMVRERVIDLTRQLLRGLEHAHRMGLVHRDLKPENVLVERLVDGKEIPRIVDFGIAVLRDGDDVSGEGRRLTSAGVVMGTPMYMSPEHARGDVVDARTDLFSLGVIVFEMLAGLPPFEGSGVEVMMQNITQDPPSVATRARIDVDPLLEAFARKLMARELVDRFASAQAALDVLDLIERDRSAAGAALGVVCNVPQPVQDIVATQRHNALPVLADPPRQRPRGMTLGAAAMAVLALVGAFLLGVAVG